MKKIIAVFLICITLCSLVACNSNTDPDVSTLSEEKVKEVEDLIDLASLVYGSDYECKQWIEDAERAYNELDENLKARVSNYTEIEKAKKKYKYWEYYDDASNKTLSELKFKLKDPASLQIHYKMVNVYYDANVEKGLLVSVEINYSADNSFGGAVRADWKVFYEVDENGNLSASMPYDDIHDKIEELDAVKVYLDDFDK